MKIAYLFSRYPVPSQTFCDTEMRALEAAGFEVEIYSCSPPANAFRHGADDRPRAPVFYAPPAEALAWREAAARHEGRWPSGMVADHEARYGPRYDPPRRARHALYFADLLRRRGIEHLHVHFANRATHAALFIHALTGLPFSFTAHAQDFLVDLGNDALLGEMCARAAFVVAVSDFSRRALVERCPSAEAKIHRVYNGLALERWPEPAGPPAGEDGALRIFSVGRLVAFKGFDDLAAACAALKRRGVAFRCEIAGEGPLRGGLERRISAENLDDCVRLTGLLPQAEIRARLAACDVFALACRVDEENGACDVLPTVILEAMAAGRPVVSTRLAGVPEMVDDGATGYLVPSGDPPALADALARLSADPPGRARLGRAGRRKLEAKFSAADSAGQLAMLFSSEAARSARRSADTMLAGMGTVLLFDRWPHDEAGLDDALGILRERLPGLRLIALGAGAAPSSGADLAATLALVAAFELLPDAMVLEGEWRERDADAHRMESWRADLGGGAGETENFLLAARRALYLHRQTLAGTVPTHLHAVGPHSVLCAWVLGRLSAARRASFFLPPGVAGARLPGSMLRRLAAGFVGGWIAGERKLAAALGTGFRGEDFPAGMTGWLLWAECVLAGEKSEV